MSKIYCRIAQILIIITHLLVPELQFPPLQSKEIKQNRFLGMLKTAYCAFTPFCFLLVFEARVENEPERESDSEEEKKAVGLWG